MFNELVKNKQINPILQKLISKSLQIAKTYQKEKEQSSRANQINNLKQIVVDKLSTPLKKNKNDTNLSVSSNQKQQNTLQPSGSNLKLQRQNSKRSKGPTKEEDPPKKITKIIKNVTSQNQSQKQSTSSNGLSGKLKGILKNSLQNTANHSKANSSRGIAKHNASGSQNRTQNNQTPEANGSDFLSITQSTTRNNQALNTNSLLKILKSKGSTPSTGQSQQQSLNNSQVQLAHQLLKLLQGQKNSAGVSRQDSQNQSTGKNTLGTQDSLKKMKESEERISSPRTRLYGAASGQTAAQGKSQVQLNQVQQRIQEALQVSRQKQLDKQRESSNSLPTPIKQDLLSNQLSKIQLNLKGEGGKTQQNREKVGQILSNILKENRQLKEKLNLQNQGQSVSPVPETTQSGAAKIQQVLKILQSKRDPNSSSKPEIKLLNPVETLSQHPSQIFTPTLPDLDASVKSGKGNTDIMKRLSSGDTNLNSQPTDISSKRNRHIDQPNQLKVPNMIDQYLFGNQTGERSVSQSLKQKRLLPLRSGEDVKIQAKDKLTGEEQEFNQRSNSQPRIVISSSSKPSMNMSPTNPLISSNLTFNYDTNDQNMIRNHPNPNQNHFQQLESKQRQEHSGKKENSFYLSSSRRGDKSGGQSNTRKSSAQEEQKTRSFLDFQGGPEKKSIGRTAKEIVKERRNLKYMLLLKQRKERWDHQQNHPILGGFDASMKDKESKKTKKIQMNIQKLDAIMEDIKKEKRQKLRRQGLIIEDRSEANEFRRQITSSLNTSKNRRDQDDAEDDDQSQDFD